MDYLSIIFNWLEQGKMVVFVGVPQTEPNLADCRLVANNDPDDSIHFMYVEQHEGSPLFHWSSDYGNMCPSQDHGSITKYQGK